MRFPSQRLVIDDGEIKMQDGSDVREYLRQWQVAQGVRNGFDVNLISRPALQQLLNEADAVQEERFALSA